VEGVVELVWPKGFLAGVEGDPKAEAPKAGVDVWPKPVLPNAEVEAAGEAGVVAWPKPVLPNADDEEAAGFDAGDADCAKLVCPNAVEVEEEPKAGLPNAEPVEA
jgi:hypothetical protein